MSDFKAKIHQIRFHPPLGALTALPGPPLTGPTSKGRGRPREGGEGREGREREGGEGEE